MIRFDFRKNWNKSVKPHLNDPDVKFWLWCGMYLLNHVNHGGFLSPNDPPHSLSTRITEEDISKIKEDTLRWYQPLGCCHWIAPFCFALGQKIYPDLKWVIITNDEHTAAVGLKETHIKDSNLTHFYHIVFDILTESGKSEDIMKRCGWQPYSKGTYKTYNNPYDYLVDLCSEMNNIDFELQPQELVDMILDNFMKTC